MTDNIQTATQRICELKKQHLPLLQECLKADDGKVFGVDFLAWAAINRSMSNIDGFLSIIGQQNYILANSILRLQLDTILRFFAIHLVDAPHDFALRILKGESLKNIKDKQGQKMTDRYLCERFAEKENLAWVVTVYERSSGYIHLSDKHIFSVFSDFKDAKEGDNFNTINLLCGDGGNKAIPEEFKLETIQCMQQITKLILKYVYGWACTKKNPVQKEAA
jgi:hypothetical protein